MYKVGKSLFVAGLLVASAQALATEKAAENVKDATVSLVGRCWNTVSSVPSALASAASSAGKSIKVNAVAAGNTVKGKTSGLVNYLVNLGVNTPDISNTKYWSVQGAKVAATAVAAVALYYAYNKVSAKTTKQADATEQEEDTENTYYYVSTDVPAAQEAARSAEQTAVVELTPAVEEVVSEAIAPSAIEAE
jgi:hypothetical protein